MTCCGGKRTELRNSRQTSSKVQPASVTPAALPGVAVRTTAAGKPAPPAGGTAPGAAVQAQVGVVTLRYLGGAPIQVVGPASHATYRFSREAPLQRIARADAEPLLASGYFRMEI